MNLRRNHTPTRCADTSVAIRPIRKAKGKAILPLHKGRRTYGLTHVNFDVLNNWKLELARRLRQGSELFEFTYATSPAILSRATFVWQVMSFLKRDANADVGNKRLFVLVGELRTVSEHLVARHACIKEPSSVFFVHRDRQRGFDANGEVAHQFVVQ